MPRLALFIAAITAVLTCAQCSTDAEKHRPRNVEVQVINDTTVQLHWERPKSAELAGCPISRYTVRLRADGARRSRTWKVDGDRRSVTLYGLDPDAAYHVRVLAVVCHGKGKPSPWLGVRTARSVGTDNNVDAKPMSSEHQSLDDEQETSVPGKPTYVRTRTFSDSVMVSWMAPEDGDVVRGYMVGYGEGVPDVNWRYVDASSNNVTIDNLKPATEYIISLRAFNNRGKGQVIYDLIYTRESTGPTMPCPVDLQTKVLSPSTVWLEWKDPTLGRVQQLTDSRYYNVHYRPLVASRDSAPGGRTLSVVVKATHIVFYDLRPGTRYEFKVRTVKDAVASTFSDTAVNKTYETAPSSPPRAVTVMNTETSGVVTVNWRPPRLPNGDITGYMVLYSQNADLPPDEWPVKSVAGPEIETTVDNLIPNVMYHLRVQARNSIGYSPLSSNTVFYTKPILDSVPTSSAGDVTSTVHDADEYDNSNSSLSSRTTVMTSEGDKHPADDDADKLVQPQSAGNITDRGQRRQQQRQPVGGKTKRDDDPVQADDDPLPSPPVPEARPYRADPEVKFHATVHHLVTAFITWPEVNSCGRDDGVASWGATVVGYRLRYANTATPSSPPTELDVEDNVATIDGLLASAEYWYQLQYVFNDGSHSLWTQKQLLAT